MLTYPSYATQTEIKAYYRACLIANLAKPIMISESTATVVIYAYDNIRSLMALEEPRIVAFIDIGNANLTVTFA